VARSAFVVCLTFLLAFNNLLAQQGDESWLSLSRLSLSASGSYHYAPWKKYNESLKLVQEAVQYNPAYSYPGGSLEKINGDLTYQIEASYRVFSSFAVTLNAGWLQTGSVIDFRNESPTARSDDRQPYRQSMWLSSVHFGAGLSYAYEINDLIRLSAGASIVRYPAHLNFQAVSQIPNTANVFDANLQETALGFHAHVQAELQAFGPIRLTSRLEYRWLRLENLSGNGSETDLYTDVNGTSVQGPRAFEAQLGEAGEYLGLMILPSNVNVNSYLLHQLWARTPSGFWWEIERPASLDLSGFGISLGVSYAF
jgi:hypothetical protein